ncbi:MAG: sulfurtransferase [Prochlorothrix sp.]
MISPLISPQDLADRLQDNPESLVLCDCRFNLADPQQGRSQYTAGHLPGAYYLDLDQDLASPVQRYGGRHPLPDLDQLAAKLAACGVRWGETWVVAYDASRFAFASRLWWLLRYMGHDRVLVLDGGIKAWEAAGLELSAAVPNARSGNFAYQLRPEMVVNVDAVQARKELPGVAVVDSREAGRYRGEFEPIDPVAGCIPGAINRVWQEVTTDTGTAQPISWHQDRWAEVADAEEVMVYCGSGVTACVNLLSLDLAGLKTGKLYVGSWSDWCASVLNAPPKGFET